MPTLEQMKIRQSVLANFGDFALRCDDLDEILHEACRLVSNALGTDLAKVLEIEEGGAAAFVKAGIGWRPGIVGKERLSFSERSSETYSLKVRAPVVSRDIREEDRFEFADFLIEHGAVSLVNVPFYWAAIFSYQQFGELFMATFDTHQSELGNSAIASILREEEGLDITETSARDRNRAVWRFLRWHRIRPSRTSRNVRAKLS